ncbi:helix-turn-helix domain-containing protein [Streptomyces sp. NPDC003077]|uniref:helix-turn-helix transcriptional regulator n=1 Tax=Streptomyces sp. NPDC003077 TaxID=3154443 RepID=UPI0033B9AC7E
MAAPRGSRRAEVIHVLREAGIPLGVTDIARRIGTHPNTARFHLDALVTEGTVERTLEQRPGPGRPRTVYAMRPGMNRGGARDYRLLAEVLLGHLSSAASGTDEQLEEAGRAWGRFLVDRPPPFERLTREQTVARLTTLLTGLGFQPEAEPDAAAPERVRLRHCPFLELAEKHGALVCRVHLGLMRGALAELRGPVTVARLEPFTASGTCLAHLGCVDAG